MITEVSEITHKYDPKQTCIKQGIESIHMHSLGINGEGSHWNNLLTQVYVKNCQ